MLKYAEKFRCLIHLDASWLWFWFQLKFHLYYILSFQIIPWKLTFCLCTALFQWNNHIYTIPNLDISDMKYSRENTGNVSVMTQHATLPPAWPVFRLSSCPPSPRSSGPRIKLFWFHKICACNKKTLNFNKDFALQLILCIDTGYKLTDY